MNTYYNKAVSCLCILIISISQNLFAVSITPSQINFQCDIQQLDTLDLTTNSLSNEPRISMRTEAIVPPRAFEFSMPAQKVINEQQILDLLVAEGEAEVLITLNYTLCEGVPNLPLLTDKIEFLQGNLMNEPNMADIAIKKLHENIPVANILINADDLEFLRNSQWVSSIEPLIYFEIETAQGVPLMGGDVYRSQFDGSGVSIAILDTGINYNHAAFGGGGFPNSKVIGGYDYGNNDADPMPSTSQHHGTSVAGIAAGDITNNSSYPNYIGGVAYGAKLYALKITPDGSGSTDTAKMTSAINWCINNQYNDPDNPILVINISMGGGRYTSTCDGSSSALTNAVNAAKSAGIAVVSSSGNDGFCDAMGIPACISNIISVGAVFDAAIGNVGFNLDPQSCIYTGSAYYVSAQADMVTQYSNSSNLLDVLAPSHYATTPNITGYTNFFGGTSAASPYAAGAIAVLQSKVAQATGEFLSVDEIKSVLTGQGDPIEDWRNYIVKPRINIENALEYLSPLAGEPIYVYNSKNSGSITAITAPQWISIYPDLPISLPGKTTTTIYAIADCSVCNYQQLEDVITISGSKFPPSSSFSQDIAITLNCPPCEFSASLTENCEVDLLDFAILADCWLSSDSNCEIANIDGNLPVNTGDLEIMAEQWLSGK